MNRIALIAVAALALVTSAFAAPTFDVAPGMSEVGIDPGQTATISIIGTGPTLALGFQGMELYSALSGNFEIVDLLVDQAGAGTGWEGKSTPATIVIDPSLKAALGMVTTTSGGIPTGSVVAKILVKATGAIGDTGSLTTDGLQFWGAASNFADGMEAVQDSVRLVITPEPMTALMLLGVLPLIRRRRA